MAYITSNEENKQFKIPRVVTFQQEEKSNEGNYRTNVNLPIEGSTRSRFKRIHQDNMEHEPDKNMVIDNSEIGKTG